SESLPRIAMDSGGPAVPPPDLERPERTSHFPAHVPWRGTGLRCRSLGTLRGTIRAPAQGLPLGKAGPARQTSPPGAPPCARCDAQTCAWRFPACEPFHAAVPGCPSPRATPPATPHRQSTPPPSFCGARPVLLVPAVLVHSVPADCPGENR